MLNQYQNINTYDRLLTGNTVDSLSEAITSDPSILTRKDAEGSTLLHALSTKGFKTVSYSQNLTIHAINLLKKAPKGSVNIQDGKGLTPLHYQVLMALPRADQNDQRALKHIHERAQVFPMFVNFALENAYDFTLADSDHGFTVFHLLAREKSLEATELLNAILNNPAFNDTGSLNSPSKKGQTPLDLSITQGSITTANLLIDKGASPNKALELLEEYRSHLQKRFNGGKFTEEAYGKRINKIEELEGKINLKLQSASQNRKACQFL